MSLSALSQAVVSRFEADEASESEGGGLGHFGDDHVAEVAQLAMAAHAAPGASQRGCSHLYRKNNFQFCRE